MIVRRRLAAAGVVATLLLSACGAAPSAEGGYVSGDGTITRIPPTARTPAPVIAGTTLDNNEWTSAEAGGRVLVYNVWGSWCAPCIKEAPALVNAANRTTRLAQFIGLNTRDAGIPQAKAFVRDFKVPYPNLFDPSGALVLRFAGQLPLNAIPSTVVVDAQGRIAARVVGDASESVLVGLVEDVAAGR